MKNYVIFLLILLMGINANCQKNEKFKEGVKVTSKEIIFKLDSINSILFVFKGDTHLVDNYMSFTEELQNQAEQFDLSFIYDLFTKQPLESDLEPISKNMYDCLKHDVVCTINILSIKSCDNNMGSKRKQNYDLSVRLHSCNTNKTVMVTMLNVNSYYTISTQNKNLSKLIYSMIKEAIND